MSMGKQSWGGINLYKDRVTSNNIRCCNLQSVYSQSLRNAGSGSPLEASRFRNKQDETNCLEGGVLIWILSGHLSKQLCAEIKFKQKMQTLFSLCWSINHKRLAPTCDWYHYVQRKRLHSFNECKSVIKIVLNVCHIIMPLNSAILQS